MLDRKARSSRLLVVGVLAAALLLSGCTGGNGPDSPTASGSPDGSGSPAGSGPSAAGPGEQASAFPVPAAAEPVPLPDLGAREGGDVTYTLNAVRRVSPEAVSVEGTLTAVKGNTPLIDFAEPGFKVRDVDGTTPYTYEISAVTLAAPGDPKVYLPLRDEKGFCACSQGILGIDEGESMGVYTYVTAPADAQTVSVTVSPFGVFPNVPVTS